VKTKISLLFAWLIICSAAFAATGDTLPSHFIDMKGRVVMGKKALTNALVKVYADTTSSIVQRMETDAEGYLALHLPLQKPYTIKISKPGYVTKIVYLDARLPESEETGDYYFEFKVDLFEEIEGLDVSMLKYPIAIITFNTFKKNFDYDYNYTSMINIRLKKVYDEYKVLKKNNGQKPPEKPSDKKETGPAPEITDPRPVAVIPAGPKVTYSVEILTSAEQQQRNAPVFKGMVNVKEYQEGGQYKYYVGDYPTEKDAEKMKGNILGYFSGATIISFINGKKVVPEAVDIPQGK
jgi:hypothetical protein